jgi:hypothetical protein
MKFTFVSSMDEVLQHALLPSDPVPDQEIPLTAANDGKSEIRPESSGEGAREPVARVAKG